MIDEKIAYSMAQELLKRASDDPERPWRLIEFPQGWLIAEEYIHGKSPVGGAGRVIEKESGNVLRFPSWVPTGRILREFEAVVKNARVQSD